MDAFPQGSPLGRGGGWGGRGGHIRAPFVGSGAPFSLDKLSAGAVVVAFGVGQLLQSPWFKDRNCFATQLGRVRVSYAGVGVTLINMLYFCSVSVLVGGFCVAVEDGASEPEIQHGTSHPMEACPASLELIKNDISCRRFDSCCSTCLGNGSAGVWIVFSVSIVGKVLRCHSSVLDRPDSMRIDVRSGLVFGDENPAVRKCE